METEIHMIKEDGFLSIGGIPVYGLDFSDPNFDNIVSIKCYRGKTRVVKIVDGEEHYDDKLELSLMVLLSILHSANKATTEVKMKRKKLLDSTDWTQTGDQLLSRKAVWSSYRKALRDITEQTGYPDNVVWPEPPADE